MSKILVTGSTGFIGSHLVEKLIGLNHDVTCLIRKNSNTRWLDYLKYNDKLKFRYDLNGHVDSFDTVYHVAGILGNNKVPLIEYSKVHVELTYELLSRMKPEQKFVYMSSAWVNMVDKPYELTKFDGELLVKLSGVKYSIIRPGFVYGERDMHLLNIFKMVKWLKTFTPIIGSGTNLICPTYVKDVVNVMANPKDGITQIVGKPISIRMFMYSIADMMKINRSKITLSYIPKPFRELLKWDFFARERVFESDVDTTPLLQGLSNTIKWYKVHCYL